MQLPPMAAAFEATVRVDDVWRAAVALLEGHNRRRAAVRALTGIDEALNFDAERLPELLDRATAVALQVCIEKGVLSIYAFNPQSARFHRLPKDGLISSFVGVSRMAGQDTSERAGRTAETSWATGTLHEIDCGKSLYRLARERVPLMTSEPEASAALDALRSI